MPNDEAGGKYGLQVSRGMCFGGDEGAAERAYAGGSVR